jgi:TolB-like protein
MIRQHRFPIPLFAVLLAPLLAATALPALAATVEVKLKLPQRARLDLRDRETIAVAPFVVVSQEGEGEERLQGRNIDVQKEFERYLLKVLRRETELEVVEPGPVDYPTFDFEQLGKQRDFWRALGERAQADLILAGGLDFDIQDRTGYRTEEYVSPFNGRTYYRQVLVEQTGFEYDILMHVYDGRSGELIYQDNFKDFQSFEGESADPLLGMFENLFSLEDRILGVFTQKEVEASRTLFTQ